MRGEIGPGPNRMNVYTVRKASAGLAAYIGANGGEAKARRCDRVRFPPQIA